MWKGVDCPWKNKSQRPERSPYPACWPFAQTRKPGLQTGWQLPKEQLAAIVAGCGLSPAVRGEALGLEEYARLSDALLAAAGE